MTLRELADLRLRFAPGLCVIDPVEAADAWTSLCDLRIAKAAAYRLDLDQIDPTTGRE
ncbi:hypothetical protein QA811_02225 [Streptomyces sp. B21-102]|jgi:hypothetical protein|uniref:hypothetical protein n=1 Tax=Streptomyces sp. B21-102 TaxID=3039416 RepID=UPI002FF13FD0